MGRFYYNPKGYPVWNDSGKLVHRTIAQPKGDQITHHVDGNPKNFRRKMLKGRRKKWLPLICLMEFKTGKIKIENKETVTSYYFSLVFPLRFLKCLQSGKNRKANN